MKTYRYWISTVSKEHVERGKAGGFAQVCHGKSTPLKRMLPYDILIYSSPNLVFGQKTPCQKFTALGQIRDKLIYQVEMFSDFKPFRRDVHYFKTEDADIRSLIPDLNFIQNKGKWGYHFRFGLFQIDKDDAMLIAQAMQLGDNEFNELFLQET